MAGTRIFELIDNAIDEVRHRDLVASTFMIDTLLDIRLEAAVPEERKEVCA